MNLDSALDALARAEPGMLPTDAMRWLQQNSTISAPALIAALERAIAGDQLSAEFKHQLFFAIYLLGDMRETRAFEPLCRLARQGEKLDDILGDGVTESLENVLVRLFDGNANTLKDVVQEPLADQFVRGSALDALKLLSALGQIPESDMAAYLRALPDLLQRDSNFIWASWAIAVGDFGLADLRPQVEWAIEEEYVPYFTTSLKHFDQDIAKARSDPELAHRLERDLARLFDDSVAELAQWHGFSEAYRQSLTRQSKPLPSDHAWIGGPAVNPHRHVGRNDPCPCGSGKKYKKCCLEKDLTAE